MNKEDKYHENRPMVSIIIPTFNCASYVCRAIDSVLKKGKNNFEIIVVDDASTDQTQEILNNSYKNNETVKIIRHQNNLKLGAARNTGLDLARGKYVFFLDADDWLEEGSIEELIILAEKNKAEIVACGMKKVWDNGEQQSYHGHNFSCQGGVEALTQFATHKIGSIVCNKLFLRDFIEKNQLRFIVGFWHEDVMFTAKAIYQCEKYISVDNQWYNYFQRNKSIVNSKQTQLHLESYLKLYLDMIEFIKNNNLFETREGKILSMGLLKAHCSDAIYPNLKRYVNARSKTEWESECIEACSKVFGVDGLGIADFLVRAMNDVEYRKDENRKSFLILGMKKVKDFIVDSSLRQPARKIYYAIRFKKIP